MKRGLGGDGVTFSLLIGHQIMVDRAERGSEMESRMLSCSAVTEKTSDFIDGNVGILSRFQLKLHLLACKHCRRFVRQMRGTIAILRQSGDKPSVAAVDSRLLSAFRARGRPRE